MPSRISKKLYVCKHGKAALDSVIDTATQDKSNAERKRAGKAAKEAEQQRNISRNSVQSKIVICPEKEKGSNMAYRKEVIEIL